MSTYVQSGTEALLGSPRPPEPPVQRDTSEEHLSYWKSRLSGCCDLLALPTDRPRQAHSSFQGAQETRPLPQILLAKLRSLADQEQALLSDVLFSAFQTMLHRYAGSPDIVTGSHLSRGTLVLRTDFSGDPGFRDVLTQVRKYLQEARDHQHIPLEEVMEALGLEPTGGHSPLFQIRFQLYDLTDDTEGLQSLRESLDSDPASPAFDLSLEVRLGSRASHCELNYNAGLFEASTIQRMLGHFETILQGAVENPGESVSRLPLVTQAELRQILVEWNDTRADYPQTCMHRLFEEQVGRTPDAIALVYEDQQRTYADLNAEANRLAHALIHRGVGPDVMVPICIERSLELIVGLLAILKAGGAYVPLDPSYPKERLACMLDDLQAPLLLSRGAVAEGLPQFTGSVLPVERWAEITASQSPENPVSTVGPDNLAYVLYTSGSTGQPKGVLIPHRALVNYLTWCTAAYSAGQGRGSPVHTSIGFDLTVTSLFPPLLAGRAAVLVREDPTLETLTAALRGCDFGIVKLTPAHLEALSHKFSPGEPGMVARTFVIGGEALLGKSLSFWRKQLPAARLINEYGPTETTVGCCVYEVPAGAIPASAVPIGRPIANTRLYVLDRNLQPVPIGVSGELHIAGDGLALGYHRQPELTAERFIPDPFRSEPAARMYKTGDLVRYRSDGNLEFLGRLDHQVKIRGFRVELSEIEAALVGHPDIREAVVVASEEGPGDRRLIAYVVPVRGCATTEMQLRSFLKQKLPDYMLPARHVFLDFLPLTSNGKVNRRALPPPGPRNETRLGPVDAPRDALEIQLAKVWEEVLRARPIGIKEDFFDLGGNSMLAIRMLARVEKMLHRRITLAALMLAPTIEKLARTLRHPDALSRPQVFGIQPNGSRPPFFCVGAGPLFRTLANSLGPDQPFLGVPLPDLNALPTPYRLEDIATHCTRTLLEVQSHGPYFLGGWSDAGVMAYEMAQQLRERGETVALVVLFDAENQAHLPDGASPLESARMRFCFFAQWLRLQCRTLWRLKPREVARYLRLRLTFRLAWVKGLIRDFAYRVHLRSGWRFNHGLHNIEHLSVFVSKNYQPRPYDGRVLLFRRAQRPQGHYRDPEYGWGQLVLGLDIHEVPGNHIDMFLDPNVRVLADKLSASLLEAQEVSKAPAAGANQG